MKKAFFSGLALLFPIVFTLVVTIWLFNLITEPIAHLLQVDSIPQELAQIFSFILLFATIFLLGFLTKIYIFHKVYLLFHALFKKIPFFRSIYNAAHEVAETLLTEDKRGYSSVVKVAYPAKGSKVIGLIPRMDTQICPTFGDLIPVLIPGSINPLMGFLVLYHKKDIEYLDVGLEEGLKWYLSVGCIPPR